MRVTDLQAAFGLSQLKRLPQFVEARRENFKFLRDGLADLEEYFILPKRRRTPSRLGSGSLSGYGIRSIR